ncbi:MAG: hypothetical protein KJ583_01630 [Nanoarchaeota archaeon]|nr:hypothetical protein [Nanoarchaeota archaeon]MBU1269168.1 hypothetical protein [Nanoarchaeota archaeon]MBU1603993.1 hypothetical protein [Nanoarchaeota archaeon]MBU2443047.1 hypothetical protein [Nanoarchaeota archaeon]
MSIKSFNVEEETYKKFSEYCKGSGLSMSKQIDFFMKSVVEEEPEARKEYLDKLNKIRKEKSIHIGGLDAFKKRYGLQ